MSTSGIAYGVRANPALSEADIIVPEGWLSDINKAALIFPLRLFRIAHIQIGADRIFTWSYCAFDARTNPPIMRDRGHFVGEFVVKLGFLALSDVPHKLLIFWRTRHDSNL